MAPSSSCSTASTTARPHRRRCSAREAVTRLRTNGVRGRRSLSYPVVDLPPLRRPSRRSHSHQELFMRVSVLASLLLVASSASPLRLDAQQAPPATAAPAAAPAPAAPVDPNAWRID